MQLKIEYVPIEEIKPYAGNSKLHPASQIEQIKNSIKEFGFDDPIAIWNGEIVEGHGRYIASQEMGLDTVPVIRLDHLTDEQRRAYGIAHNKLTINSGFNLELLELEMQALELDMSDFGFTEAEILELTVDDTPEEVPETNAGAGNLTSTIPTVNGEQPVYGSAGDGEGYFVPDPTQPVSKEELDQYAERAETLVTKRVIIVYRTDEEEEYLKSLLKVDPEKALGVVYDTASLMNDGEE